MADDGHSLSGSCNHILEDGVLTRSQFSQCFSVVAFLVDESFPRLMKVLYGPDGVPASIDQIPHIVMREDRGPEIEPETQEESESEDESENAEEVETKRRIN
jgi:hypothetical protein